MALSIAINDISLKWRNFAVKNGSLDPYQVLYGMICHVYAGAYDQPLCQI